MDIKSARQAAGLTQIQLADLVGMNRSQIQKIERGEIDPANLTARNWIKLCATLDISPWSILEEDAKRTSR